MGTHKALSSSQSCYALKNVRCHVDTFKSLKTSVTIRSLWVLSVLTDESHILIQMLLGAVWSSMCSYSLHKGNIWIYSLYCSLILMRSNNWQYIMNTEYTFSHFVMAAWDSVFAFHCHTLTCSSTILTQVRRCVCGGTSRMEAGGLSQRQSGQFALTFARPYSVQDPHTAKAKERGRGHQWNTDLHLLNY